jgi:hypothetical protein
MIILVDFLAIIGVAIILWVVVGLLYLRVRDEILLRQLKGRQRVLDWKEVEGHLNAGMGTLIVEQTNKTGIRFWWTKDDLISTAPSPILQVEDLGHDYLRGKSARPFVVWCFDNYLSVDSGKASLAPPENLRLPPGPVKTEFLHSVYPNAKIVHTVLA